MSVHAPAAPTLQRSTADRAPGRASNARRSRRPARIGPDHVLASAGLMLLTLATAFSMCRVFAGWGYLRPMVEMAVVIHVVALALRLSRVHALIALPVGVLATYEMVALLFYRESMRFGLPSGATADLLHLDLRLVWTQFPTAVAPVPSVGAYVVVATVAIGFVVLLADAFAFRAFGRAEAAVPTGVLFVFTAALGTERHRVLATAAWLAAALVVVGMLRALHSGSDESWLGRRGRTLRAAAPSALSVAVIAALVAAIAGPALPGAESDPLLDTHQGDGDVTQVLNPFVDIRGQLVNRSHTEMFTVSAPVASYWRIAGASEFDGQTFSPIDGTMNPADGDITQLPPGASLMQQTFTIANMRGKQIPAAIQPVRVSQSGVYWEPVDGTLIVEEDVEEGDVFNIASYDPNPTADQLRNATASSPPDGHFLDLPGDFPAEVVQAALDVTAGAATPYDQAIALQNWFRTFDYDIHVQQGHDEDAILAFLSVKRGYCEQFAATFAAMARSLGIPTRVAVGYTQGIQQPDGTFKVYGMHAHAWPEVWFDGYGWVLFEPTPGRGAPGHVETTGVDPQQTSEQLPVGGEPVPVTAAPSPTGQVATPRTEPGLGNTTPTTAPVTLPPLRSDDGGGPGLTFWVLLGMFLVGGWMVAMPAMVLRFTRRGATASEQVVSAWHGTVGALTLAGATPPQGLTPMEWATLVDDKYVPDRRALVELARFVTRAIYSPTGVGDPVALRAAVLQTQIEQSAREVTPWHVRLLLRLDPRLVRQRLIGDAPLTGMDAVAEEEPSDGPIDPGLVDAWGRHDG